MAYKRVLLKLSGEALLGEKSFGVDYKAISRFSEEIKSVYEVGIQIAIVIGGGNIVRGSTIAEQGMDRSRADFLGMLATIMNAISLQTALEKIGVDVCVLSAIPMISICQPFTRREAIKHLEKKRVVILAGGTGNPFFTTDSAAALRSAELDCDVLAKGTQVDGVYTADPRKEKNAKRYDTLSYKQVLNDDLQVMDAAAISLARENNIPIIVFSIHEKKAFLNVLEGRGAHTLIK